MSLLQLYIVLLTYPSNKIMIVLDVLSPCGPLDEKNKRKIPVNHEYIYKIEFTYLWISIAESQEDVFIFSPCSSTLILALVTWTR